jgi:copper chaperone
VFKTIVLEVVGDQKLACEGCEERVEDLLKAMQGVRKVRARAGKQRIEVLFDAARVEPAAMTERLREAGYETRLTA